MLKRKYLASFKGHIKLPVEQQGEFSAPADLDVLGARAMFTKFLKDNKELVDFEVTQFELSPIPDKTVEITAAAPEAIPADSISAVEEKPTLQ